jgi:hypothetical protein
MERGPKRCSRSGAAVELPLEDLRLRPPLSIAHGLLRGDARLMTRRVASVASACRPYRDVACAPALEFHEGTCSIYKVPSVELLRSDR